MYICTFVPVAYVAIHTTIAEERKARTDADTLYLPLASVLGNAKDNAMRNKGRIDVDALLTGINPLCEPTNPTEEIGSHRL